MEFSKTLKETVEDHGLLAKKALGQNFLLDQNITDKIIQLSLSAQGLTDFQNFEVLEIGPGPGGLTRAVLKKNPKVLNVVEMDERCIEIMQELQEQTKTKINIFQGDALKFEIKTLSLSNLQIVSNLPYNISVVLLTMWLKQMKDIKAMTLMFQKEVADRICADIKTKDYGRLSVLAQLVCQIKKLTTLKPECFVPAPKIYSTVLLFLPLDEIPNIKELEKVEELTGMAFSKRRKMIRQSLKSVPNLEKICGEVGVLPTSRAEEITPNQYLKIAKLLLC